jgi:hypothetical protein
MHKKYMVRLSDAERGICQQIIKHLQGSSQTLRRAHILLKSDAEHRQEPPTRPKLDGEAEAQVIAMRWGKPPVGYGHGTLQLLADALVALEVVESISHETVRKTRKKTA